MNTISGLLVRFLQMGIKLEDYRVLRGLSSTKGIKCNFRLILCIILRSSISSFYWDIMKHPLLHEREPNLSATQWYIYFSSFQIQPWVIAQSFWVYITIFQQTGLLFKCHERWVLKIINGFIKILLYMTSQVVIN